MNNLIIAFLAIFCVGVVAPMEAQSAPENYILRGDVNNDDSIDLADGVMLLRFLFQEHYIMCLDAADIDDSGVVNIADAFNSLHNFFIADTPFPPTGYCEQDITPDNLGICYDHCS